MCWGHILTRTRRAQTVEKTTGIPYFFLLAILSHRIFHITSGFSVTKGEACKNGKCILFLENPPCAGLVWSGNPVQLDLVNIGPVLMMSASRLCTTRVGRFPPISCHQMALACSSISSIWSYCMAAPQRVHQLCDNDLSFPPYTITLPANKGLAQLMTPVCTSRYWGHISVTLETYGKGIAIVWSLPGVYKIFNETKPKNMNTPTVHKPLSHPPCTWW